jgi:hypothetical protein
MLLFSYTSRPTTFNDPLFFETRNVAPLESRRQNCECYTKHWMNLIVLHMIKIWGKVSATGGNKTSETRHTLIGWQQRNECSKCCVGALEPGTSSGHRRTNITQVPPSHPLARRQHAVWFLLHRDKTWQPPHMKKNRSVFWARKQERETGVITRRAAHAPYEQDILHRGL